jgi:predicted anti-sigma-YlaC factor YlaD
MTSPETCDALRWDIMRVADQEADLETRARVEAHLAGCARCRDEYDSLMKLKGATAGMRLLDLPDARWAGYWQDLYRRLERGTGWLLASLGLLLVVGYALFRLLSGFLVNPEIPIVLRGGIALVVAGVVVLAVSLVRERLYARKIERYDRVEL